MGAAHRVLCFCELKATLFISVNVLIDRFWGTKNCYTNASLLLVWSSCVVVYVTRKQAPPASAAGSATRACVGSFSGGRAPLGRSRHTQTSCASKASLRRTEVQITCGRISPFSGRDYVKSLRSSYMGLYPQSFDHENGSNDTTVPGRKAHGLLDQPSPGLRVITKMRRRQRDLVAELGDEQGAGRVLAH